jgi:hypothetical protein
MQDTALSIETLTSSEMQLGREIAFSLANVISGYGTTCYTSLEMRHYYTGINQPTVDNFKQFEAIGKLLCLDASVSHQLATTKVLSACLQLELGFGVCVPLELSRQLPSLREIRIYKIIGAYLASI